MSGENIPKSNSLPLPDAFTGNVYFHFDNYLYALNVRKEYILHLELGRENVKVSVVNKNKNIIMFASQRNCKL